MLSKFLPTPSDYPPEQVTSLRANLAMHLSDGSFYVLGMSFMAVPTVFPIFIRELGGDALAIGSVHVLWTIGANIPAAFVAQRLKRKSLFKPQMVSWGLIHRMMLLVSSVTVLLAVGVLSSAMTVPLFLALLFLTALFGSMSGLPWFQVYTKTVPVKLRGRLMGLRQLIGSTAGAAGGYLVGLVIQVLPFPYNFSLLFLFGFTFTMISFFFLTKIEERPTIHPEYGSLPSINLAAEMKRILRSNQSYRYYLISDALILMSMSSASFYSIFAIEKFQLPPSSAGTFSAIVMISNMIANVAFGLLADHFGHKINVITVALCSALAAAVAVFAPNMFVYGFVFLFLAAAIQIHVISRMPFIAEMTGERERPLYVGITNTVTAPALLIGLVFGAVVTTIGYETIFLISMLLALTAAFLLRFHVLEPRNSRQSD